jgi:glycosyltransferase involved in cell wall biosynthesis
VSGISVIIPAYNREELLPQTLESLLRQTFPAEEIIVVDDGSTDRTAAVAESFGKPVQVIHQENSGPAAARNRGFLESRGEFIHFFDSDDLALSNKHEVQIKALRESGADIAYGPWIKGRISDSSFVPDNQVLQQGGLPKENLIKALLSNWSIVPHTCLFRRSIVEKVGGFPEELFVAEDQLMFLRCLLEGARVVHSPHTLELYRTNNPEKITASNGAAKSRHTREWARFLLMATEECLSHGIDPKSWFGFRCRAWQAAKDLRESPLDCSDLMKSLTILYDRSNPSIKYAANQLFQQKRDGLLQRITGGRGHPYFRMGNLTEFQNNRICELFSENSGEVSS